MRSGGASPTARAGFAFRRGTARPRSAGREHQIHVSGGPVSSRFSALAAASAAGLGVSLLPASCRLPTHRVLGAAERMPPVDDFELALFYRDNASAATLALAERLIEYCGLRRS